MALRVLSITSKLLGQGTPALITFKRTMIAGGRLFREQEPVPIPQFPTTPAPGFLRLAPLLQSEISLPHLQIIKMPSIINRIPWSTPSPKSYPKDILDPSNLNLTIEAPTPVQEKKEAIRMLVIRRIKMNKHKLKKLRRKMKIVWARVRLRRATWREKIFLNTKMDQVKAAWKFDAKTHVAQLISNVRDRPEPQLWIRPGMPDSIIQEELKIRAIQKRNKFLSVLNRRNRIPMTKA